MPTLDNSPGPKYSFENDVSGRLFCWLIESGEVDFEAIIGQTAEGEPETESWVERLADALKAKVGPSWVPVPQPPAFNPAENAATHHPQADPLREYPARVPRPKAPPYNIWFRPSPSKKIKFKEVARSLLVFTGRIPPAPGW